MRFFVVFSVDCAHGIDNWDPNTETTKWDLTENEKSEYDCFETLGEDEEPEEGGFHRKYIADLSREEFDAFVNRMGLHAEAIETMGTLGPMGWTPAISFDSDETNVILNAYVTPFPDKVPVSSFWTDERQNRAWERIKRAVVSVYGR